MHNTLTLLHSLNGLHNKNKTESESGNLLASYTNTHTGKINLQEIIDVYFVLMMCFPAQTANFGRKKW